jgi:DNA-binding response OmpR family regulator
MMKRILIVEDDELIANLEKDYLTANDLTWMLPRTVARG